MAKQSSSFRKLVRSLRIMLGCWAAYMFMVGCLVFSSTHPASTTPGIYIPASTFPASTFPKATLWLLTGGLLILGIVWAVFLCVKAMGLKCPKCQKHIDLRAVSKFCPHCGKPLE